MNEKTLSFFKNSQFNTFVIMLIIVQCLQNSFLRFPSRWNSCFLSIYEPFTCMF